MSNVDVILDRLDQIIKRRQDERREIESKKEDHGNPDFRSKEDYQEQVRRWKWVEQFRIGF